MPERSVKLAAIPHIPLVKPGDDLAATLIRALDGASLAPGKQDVLVVAQKIVSKAEGRYVNLSEVSPSENARNLGEAVDKDPRLVEVILGESEEVVSYGPGVLVVAHRIGVVLANAGVDQSNLEPDGDGERVLLLPVDPDASAAVLKTRVEEHYAVELGVVISDSVGRPWRIGTVGIALGAAGLPAVNDLIGRADLCGRPLQVTQTAFADELASAASLLMGQADEGLPAVLISGLEWSAREANAKALQRPKDQDLFR
jgi:coenzyme F420-0:L-glutamate ligase/coenzyme F420-1:gamma-L-glutamate ligase